MKFTIAICIAVPAIIGIAKASEPFQESPTPKKPPTDTRSKPLNGHAHAQQLLHSYFKKDEKFESLVVRRTGGELKVDAIPNDEFKIEIRILELKPIEGVTEKANSSYHLHVKPALVVTPADVSSVEKKQLRGPTFETKGKGSKHIPQLVVDLQLTEEAKQQLKAAVLRARSTSKTTTPIIATVVNGHHDGAWSKIILDDPTSSIHWSKIGCRINCKGDEKKADRLVKHFSKPKKNQLPSQQK